MGRIEKQKRQLIEEANKRLLNEQIGCPCEDGISRIECCDFELEPVDEKKLHDMLSFHPESHTFMDSLNHNVHAHLDLNSNHLKLEFPHLGKRHDIELDLEGTLPSSHGEHHNLNYSPHIVFGGGLKIPIKSFNSHR